MPDSFRAIGTYWWCTRTIIILIFYSRLHLIPRQYLIRYSALHCQTRMAFIKERKITRYHNTAIHQQHPLPCPHFRTPKDITRPSIIHNRDRKVHWKLSDKGFNFYRNFLTIESSSSACLLSDVTNIVLMATAAAAATPQRTTTSISTPSVVPQFIILDRVA